jgi:hypothetical protein
MAKASVSVPLGKARTAPAYARLIVLLQHAKEGTLQFHLDDKGNIHFNDNGTCVMYYEVDNLEIPIDLVSRA